ncbi:hypothetical protein Sj15T_22760 [Sphingobium sp. TA15]|uniref:Putative transposase n=1 Tax=Sphingobium indicum (strain DSM 16413 / CCM 7287 / MTCC 6362 / UT26 / NBRC 101211 / UT26S) TaxID=452662 RepID=D4Z5I3_SPHIU|nr:putative transposase [Sphingobium indicum UT26S]BDD67255.1 hypothetical protein Sj15T_22760 [Sphingobium sp. TA15]
MAEQPGFFDLSDRYEALSAAGDPLERLSGVVDFELFRGPLVSSVLQFSAKVGFENSLVGGPFISFCRG